MKPAVVFDEMGWNDILPLIHDDHVPTREVGRNMVVPSIQMMLGSGTNTMHVMDEEEKEYVIG